MSAIYVLYPETTISFLSTNLHMSQKVLQIILILSSFPNVFFDMKNIARVVYISYMAHYDRRNFGYIVGKMVSNGFLITALMNLDEQINPSP